nr:hypothetical protein [uncultured Pedobacter sp.]
MNLINSLEVLTHKPLKMKTPLSAIYGGDSIFAFSQTSIKTVNLFFSGSVTGLCKEQMLASFYLSFDFNGFLCGPIPQECAYFKSN